ncbi:MAG: BrnT family toxin [Pyrinomonadaceae bacterium]
MNFEWDDAKNKENIRKHGFDFADAWEIFEAPMHIRQDTRFDYGEVRWFGIGSLGNRIVAIAFTEPDESIVRIISLRKAFKRERKKLEQKIKD